MGIEPRTLGWWHLLCLRNHHRVCIWVDSDQGLRAGISLPKV